MHPTTPAGLNSPGPSATQKAASRAYAAINAVALANAKRILADTLRAQYTDLDAVGAPTPCPCGCEGTNPRQMAQVAHRAELGL